MDSKQIAEDLAANLVSQPGVLTSLITAEIAFSYRVNSNVASHAIRRLAKMGLVEKDQISCAGTWIYKVLVTAVH